MSDNAHPATPGGNGVHIVINDPFLHVLNATTARLKDEVSSLLPKNHKAVGKCEDTCSRIQNIYFAWEENMDAARRGLRKLDPVQRLIAYDDDIQKYLRSYNEAMNRGRENMGMAKKNWSAKCKKVYRDLDPRGKAKAGVIESVNGATGALLDGCKEIYAISKENHTLMKAACKKVLLEYNKAVKKVPAKDKKMLEHKSFSVTPKTVASFVGKPPKW